MVRIRTYKSEDLEWLCGDQHVLVSKSERFGAHNDINPISLQNAGLPKAELCGQVSAYITRGLKLDRRVSDSAVCAKSIAFVVPTTTAHANFPVSVATSQTAKAPILRR